MKSFLLTNRVVLFLGLVVVVSVGGYAIYHNLHTDQAIVTSTSTANSSSTSTELTITNATSSLVIADKYSLFAKDSYDVESNNSPRTWYVDDGIVSAGTYKGWNRIVGFRSEEEMGGGEVYIFVTKDYKTFLVNDKYAAEPVEQSHYNLEKVKRVDDSNIYDTFPLALKVSSQFALVKSWLVSGESYPTSTRPVKETYTSGLTFVGEEENFTGAYSDLNPYIESGTRFYNKDEYGVVAGYDLVNDASFQKSERDKLNKDPKVYSTMPSLQYDGSLFIPNIVGTVFYKGYDGFFQGGCGIGDSIILKDIPENNAKEIAQLPDGTLIYALTDTNNPLFKHGYGQKFQSRDDGTYYYNGKTIAPTMAEYLSRYPILLIKDPWGRYLVLLEDEYGAPGGCGKPVVYLYPTKPTEVTVSFTKHMYFDVAIPFFQDFWKVLAHPDGTLTDLKRSNTDCKKIDSTRKGSEYAQEACKDGMYPYLYWAGNVDGEYPKPKGGWVVSSQDLGKTLNEKLTTVGLSEQERKDMLEYWVPELEATHAPYFRIAFIQTSAMNQFIPMEIAPKPYTLIRVFLDWEPLALLPKELPSPQMLKSIKRQGFTAVEWGGLKR